MASTTAPVFHSAKNPSLVPDAKYRKSPEGIEEYKKARLQYPDTVWDKAYQSFLERTPDVEGNDYRHKNKTKILKIVRTRLAGGKEFLVWDEIETRYTPLGNPERFARTALGKYPIIETRKIIKQEDSGLRRVVTEATGLTKTGYSLPYTPENIDRLHKNAVDDPDADITDEEEGARPTQYLVHDTRGNRMVSINNWEGFRDGDFYELFEYGKKVSSPKEAEDIKAKQEELKQRLEDSRLDRLKRSA